MAIHTEKNKICVSLSHYVYRYKQFIDLLLFIVFHIIKNSKSHYTCSFKLKMDQNPFSTATHCPTTLLEKPKTLDP